jgi:hypothetical protein
VVIELRFEALLCPAVRLAAAQAINRPTPRQGYHPAKRSTRLGRIIFRLLPNLKKDFLEDIVRFGFFVHHSHDYRLHRFPITLIQLSQCELPAIGDRAHERFVRSVRQANAVD